MAVAHCSSRFPLENLRKVLPRDLGEYYVSYCYDWGRGGGRSSSNVHSVQPST